MPVPRPMEQYTFPGEEIAGVSGMVAPGEYYGWTPSQVITNVPQMAQGLAQMGATSIPRPPEDGMVGQYRPGQASAALATPRMYDFPLSAAQKELAASQQSRAGVGMTGQAVREREALARDAARIAENRAWLEQRQLAPIREQGEQARLTQKAMTERQLAVEQAKAESRANLLALETPQERIAARRDVIKQLMQDKDIAFKQDDRDKVIQADKDIQMAETAQAMDELKAKNQFNADQQARSFVQQARLQAQREGIDLTKSVLGLLDNPLMDQDIKAQIMSKGLENLIAEPKPIEPPTAPTGQVKATTEPTSEPEIDVIGDGVPDESLEEAKSRARFLKDALLKGTDRDGNQLTPEIRAKMQNDFDVRIKAIQNANKLKSLEG